MAPDRLNYGKYRMICSQEFNIGTKPDKNALAQIAWAVNYAAQYSE